MTSEPTKQLGPQNWTEILSKVLSKTLTGHWITKVIALDLVFQELTDIVLRRTLGAPDEWAQEQLRKIIGTIRVDAKRDLLGQSLRRLGMDNSAVEEALAASKELTWLRNTMAHSEVEISIEGLLFEGYNRGKDTTEAVTASDLEGICAAAEAAARMIGSFVREHGLDLDQSR